jgi:hypothetical protein
MSSPDDGSEPRAAPEPAAVATRGARVSAQRASDAVTAGGARTPPPRTRRGAPVHRGAPTELAEEAGEAPPAGNSGMGPDAGPQPAPGSTKVFDWHGADATADAPAAGASGGVGAVGAATPEPVEPARGARPAKPKVVRRQERRFRQTVQKVDLWSVTKMALCFYISAMGVVVVALAALWVVADSAGIIDNVENFIGDLFSSEDFQFVSAEVLRGALLIGVVMVALMVVFTIIAASFYNIFAELFGGIEIVIREEEQPPKR